MMKYFTVVMVAFVIADAEILQNKQKNVQGYREIREENKIHGRQGKGPDGAPYL